MLPPSTKQMMQKSLPFKFSFSLAIALFIAIIVLGIVSASARCHQYKYYSNCYQASSYYYYSCSNGANYCCSSYSYSYCGDYSYCRPLSSFNYYRTVPCWGVLISMQVCSALCIFLFIVVMILFCKFRKQHREQLMLASLSYANSAPINYVNVVSVAQNQMRKAPVAINQSERGYSEYNQTLIE